MAQNHGHPAQKEPRAKGMTHHENLEIDLNHASVDELADLPMVGRQRAEELVQHLPFDNWEAVERIPGFGVGDGR